MAVRMTRRCSQQRTRDKTERERGTSNMTIDLKPSPARADRDVPAPLTLTRDYSTPDRIYRAGVRISGGGVFLLLVVIGIFLAWSGYPAFQQAGWKFFTRSGFQTLGAHPTFGVLASIVGTVEVAFVAMIVGAPVAIATALFLSEYAPLKTRRSLIAMIDLAAAIPSIIFGLWAVFELQPNVVGFSTWLSHCRTGRRNHDRPDRGVDLP